MTLKTTINGLFNGKPLAATALLLPMLMLPFNAHADGPQSGTAPSSIEQSTTAAVETVSPSYFEADADGVLWFQKGTDGRGPFVMALNHADAQDGIVILIATSEADKDKALERGKQLQGWLVQHPSGPGKDKVDVAVAVLGAEGGTFYYYYVDTMRYWNDSMGENEAEGRFGLKAAAATLPDVIVTYLAAMQLREEEQAALHGRSVETLATTAPAP